MVVFMKEIGSEFWDVPISDKKSNLFPDSTQWFVSGRSALKSIVMELGRSQSVAMPSWCCDSMIKPFIDAGMKVSFYPVLFDGKLTQEKTYDCDVLFLIDYFGYTGMQSVLSEFKGVVIRDVTHSLFSASYSDADYYFGSLRKWCGVWTGGYAWAEDGHKLDVNSVEEEDYVRLREAAMKQKAEYVSGIREDKKYLELYRYAEGSLDNMGICKASERDINCALYLDANQIRRKRRDNAEVLRQSFADWLVFPEMKDSDCPMFVPIIVPDGKRDNLRHFLISNEIYCPVHWPVSVYHKLDEQTRYIYDNELSLVCDQRYNEDDMNRMVKTIKLFWKEA